MFDRVLVAIDSSEHSRKVVAEAVQLASRWGSEVQVMTVRETLWATSVQTDEELAEPDEVFEHSSKVVDEATAAFKQAGVNATRAIRNATSGHVAREIVEQAKEWHATAIAMGTRGHTDLEGVVVGSVCHRVLHLSSLPVLVVT